MDWNESQMRWFSYYILPSESLSGDRKPCLSMGAATPGDSNNRGPSERSKWSWTCLGWVWLCSQVELNTPPPTPTPESSYCNNLGTFLFYLTWISVDYLSLKNTIHFKRTEPRWSVYWGLGHWHKTIGFTFWIYIEHHTACIRLCHSLQGAER